MEKINPINNGKSWTIEEENKLLQELKNNNYFNKIVEDHKRTIGSIKSRINQIAYNMHVKGKSNEEISTITKITENDLLSIIEHNKNKQINKFELNNAGNLWTKKEETRLLKELSENMCMTTISKNHTRTEESIKSRLKHVAYKMYRNGKSKNEILQVTKISENILVKIIEKNLIIY